MLQFVTNPDAKASIVKQVKEALKGGCRWIEVAMNDASEEEITLAINEIKPLCLECQAFLLLKDHAELAKTLDVGGVHLSADGMLPSKARLLLGPAAVIGVSAHNIDEVKAVRSLDIDYISLEPYKSDRIEDGEKVLGIDGIKEIDDQMRKMEINIARVAFGNIDVDDVDPLMKAGVNGIAVSKSIADASDIRMAAEAFIKALEPYEKER